LKHETPGFKPPLWRPFFRYHSYGSKLGTKCVENSNLALLHMLESCKWEEGTFEERMAYKIKLDGTE
jgi:hypothetical protein